MNQYHIFNHHKHSTNTMKQYFIIFIVLQLTFVKVFALKCYTCGFGENDLDQRCLTDPASVEIGSPITDCNKKYCTSFRQEYLDPKGKVASMSRSCEDKPQNMNTIIEDGTFRYYYKACQEELCNGGTGYDTSGGSGLIDQDNGEVIYTMGVGDNSGKIITVNSLLISFLILFVTYYNYN